MTAEHKQAPGRAGQSRDLWKSHQLDDGETRAFEAGPLTLHVRATASDIWIAPQYSDDQYRMPAVSRDASAGPADWKRWAFTQPIRAIRLSPALPELPVVVKPESKFHLAPHANATVYVRVAMSVKIEALGIRDVSLMEAPTAILSKTWWGSFTGGEMAYWIASSAGRRIEVDPERWFLAICPMNVVNESEAHLPMEKILVHTGGLSLYSDADGQIWSSLAKIHYRGGTQFTQIEVQDGPPKECAGGKQVAPPRHPATRSIIGKTFGGILNWAGMT